MKFNSLFMKLAILLLAAVLLTACSPAPQETQAPENTPPPGENDPSQPYPAPDNSPGGPPYPLPTKPEEPAAIDTYVIPTPGTDTGVVIGELIDDATGEPLVHASIYLATKIAFQNSEDFSYALDPENSPNTKSDSQGKFAIGGAKPGTYILMAWTPIRASVLIDSATGKEMDIVIVAGETVDIGAHKIVDPMP